MKKSIIIFAMLLATGAVSAQEVNKETVQSQAKAAEAATSDLKKADAGEKNWKVNGATGLNAAATGLVNWAAGGNNNINGVVYGRLRALYTKGKLAWDSDIDGEYGVSYIDQTYDQFQKSNDRLKISSKVGYEVAKSWYLTGLFGFNTQFSLGRQYNGTDDFDKVISNFMAPAYTDISVGVDWKPNDIFSVYASPIAGRFTTVKVRQHLNDRFDKTGEHPDDPSTPGVGGIEQELKDKYGVWKYDKNDKRDYGINTRAELGFSIKGAINYTIKGVNIKSTLGLYTPYSWDKNIVSSRSNEPGGAKYRDNGRRFGNFDVDWDTALSYQFLKCLQVTFSSQLKYYNGVMVTGKKHDVPAERVQFKSVLGIGVGYSF